MKGLMVKDFRLMLQRKRFFLIMAFCAFFMSFSMDDSAFVTGWISMIMTIFSLSTMSYDEYDNGMPFIMSLPVSSKDYAVEKYLFGFLCGLGGWIFSVAVRLVTVLIQNKEMDLKGEMAVLGLFLALVPILLDFCLPVEIKWGSEKGRMYLLLIYGIIFVAIIAGARLLPPVPGLQDFITGFRPERVLLLLCGAAVLLTVISIWISVRIAAKKEY